MYLWGSRKALVKHLDRAVSDYVIRRDRECVLCGTFLNLTCGHVFSRTSYSTRWDERNVACQCRGCNLRHEHDPYPFFDWYQKKHGKAAFDRLHRDYSTVKKYSNADLAHLLDAWRERTRTLLSAS